MNKHLGSSFDKYLIDHQIKMAKELAALERTMKRLQAKGLVKKTARGGWTVTKGKKCTKQR